MSLTAIVILTGGCVVFAVLGIVGFAVGEIQRDIKSLAEMIQSNEHDISSLSAQLRSVSLVVGAADPDDDDP